MSQKMLLPNGFKKIGWFFLVPSAVIGFIRMISDLEQRLSLKTKVFALYNGEFLSSEKQLGVIHTDITNTLVGTVFILGALMIGFSKEKKEDEFIAKLRLSSLLWAVWVNYILLLLAFIFIYGTGFLSIMIYNMFTVMIIFIGRFNFILFKYKMSTPNEK